MEKEFYEKAIASLMVQVEKLKEEKAYWQERAEDYENGYRNVSNEVIKREKYISKLEADVEDAFSQLHGLQEKYKKLEDESKDEILKEFKMAWAKKGILV